MGKDIDISQSYTITFTGGVDLGLEELKEMKIYAGLDNIRINNIPTITVDAGLDDIRITQLPKIELDTRLSLKPTRVHLPVNYRLSIGLLGYELLGIALCGEGMVITEDYQKHIAEECT